MNIYVYNISSYILTFFIAKLISDDSFDILGLGVRHQLPTLQDSFVKLSNEDVTASDFSHKQLEDTKK